MYGDYMKKLIEMVYPYVLSVIIFMNDVELFSDDDSFRRKTPSELEFEEECEKR